MQFTYSSRFPGSLTPLRNIQSHFSQFHHLQSTINTSAYISQISSHPTLTILPSSSFAIYSCATLVMIASCDRRQYKNLPPLLASSDWKAADLLNMPVNSKTANRKGTTGETEKNRRGKLQEKAMSFHGRGTVPHSNPGELRRPKTLPELFSSGRTVVEPVSSKPPRLTKLLLNVTVQGSLGALQIIISPESTVDDLIDAAIRLYVKEARRPFLPESEPARFDLHYSQFSLESINSLSLFSSFANRCDEYWVSGARFQV